jgi:23S rRNA pseudouridine1911/1915/1917 synthase
MVKILYEDNHLIAVFKPAGVLTQGDKSNDKSLFLEVKDYLKVKYSKPANVFLGLLHRLDRPVSGIVLFAKTSKGASRLSKQFRERKIKKTYHSLVLGKPAKRSGWLTGFIEKDRETNKVKIADKGLEKNRAELFYEVLKSNKNYSLLKISPKTGKPHQIRAQLARFGCPILGDVKYGAKKNAFLALIASGLEFKTATEDKTIKLKIALPENWQRLIK